MRRLPLTATITFLALPLLAFAARGPEDQSRVFLFRNLSQAQAMAVFSASERLVLNRQSGLAVAEVFASNLGSLPSAGREVLSERGGAIAFQKAVDACLPRPSGETSSPGSIFTKEPAVLTRPANAPGRTTGDEQALSPSDTCLSEGFEYTPVWYENGGYWWHYQGGQPDNAVGDYFWLDTNCDAHTGQWGAEAIMGGTYGAALPCGSTYDYNTDSWLEYQPWITCLYGAPGAYLDFYGKVYSQTGMDYFYYLVSVDGINYSGYKISGSLYDTWYLYSQSMRSWTGLGDLTTYPHFALAFVFQSGRDIPPSFTGYGVRLDDITLTTTSISVSSVSKMASPFRLSVTGGGFLPGAWVYIDGAPAPAMKYKGPSNLVAKGGAALKAMLPLGVPVCITVLNPNGGSTPCYSYTR